MLITAWLHLTTNCPITCSCFSVPTRCPLVITAFPICWLPCSGWSTISNTLEATQVKGTSREIAIRVTAAVRVTAVEWHSVSLSVGHVTVLGHQSGATLVTALMSSHLAKGLFHQVWVSYRLIRNSLLPLFQRISKAFRLELLSILSSLDGAPLIQFL